MPDTLTDQEFMGPAPAAGAGPELSDDQFLGAKPPELSDSEFLGPQLLPGKTGLAGLWQRFRHLPSTERLFGPEVSRTDVGLEPGPGGQLAEHGAIGAIAGTPARIGADMGKGLQAAVGDIANHVAQEPEGFQPDNAPPPKAESDTTGSVPESFGGNLQHWIEHREGPLPVQQAVGLSKETDKANKDFGWQTVAADIALGLADMAPKVAMLEAAGPADAAQGATIAGRLGQSAAGAALFGFDEKGNVTKSGAAVGAIFPWATAAAAKVADKAIASGIERGLTWLEAPAARAAVHVAANQVTMDTLMVAQQSPELVELAKTDRQEFGRELAKILGSNLAFAIPEALKEHGGTEAQRGRESDVSDLADGSDGGAPGVKVTPDLAADLKAALEGNQIKPAAEKSAGGVTKGGGISDTRGDTGENTSTQTGSSPVGLDTETTARWIAGRIGASGDVPTATFNWGGLRRLFGWGQDVDPAALDELVQAGLVVPDGGGLYRMGKPVLLAGLPEEISKAPTAPVRGDKELNATATDAAGTPRVAASEPGASVEGAGAESKNPEQEQEQEAKRRGGAFKRPNILQPRADGIPDVLDAIQELGGIRPPDRDAGGEYDGYAETRARMGRLTAGFVFRKEAAHSVDTILGEMQSLAGDFRRLQSADDLWQAMQDALSERQALIEKGGTHMDQVDRLWTALTNPKSKSGLVKILSNSLMVGDTFRVRGPGISHEELTVIHKDPVTSEIQVKDGPKLGVQDFPPDVEIWVDRKSRTYAPQPQMAQIPQMGTLREEAPLFGAPESVEEQRARLAREAAAQKAKAQREEFARRAAKPLVGSKGDIGQRDMLGGGDLFSENPQHYQVDQKVTDGVASQYGVTPEETERVLAEAKPYQTEFNLSGSASEAAGAGRAGSSVQRRLSPEEERHAALSKWDPSALQSALSRHRVLSSIDADKAPVEIPQFNVNGTVIKTSADFVKVLLPLRSPYSETLKVAILDDGGKVVHSQVLYAGTLDTSVIDFRDIHRLMTRYGDLGKRLLISHNHPSGEVDPSSADERVTHQLNQYAEKVGFEVVDHVITNGTHYYSFTSKEVHAIENPTLATWEHMRRSDLKAIYDPAMMDVLVENLRQGNRDVAHIIYQNTRLKVMAIERVEPSQEAIWKAITEGQSREGAFAGLVDFGPMVGAHDAGSWTRSFNRSFAGSKFRIQDFAANGTLSGATDGLLQETGQGQPLRAEGVLAEEPAPRAPRYQDKLDRLEAISTRLGELPHRKGSGRAPTDAERSERFQLTREANEIHRALRKDPDYVADLLRRIDRLGNELVRARDAGNGLHVRELGEELRLLQDGELALVPHDLFARTYNELVARGEIMGTGPGIPAGRTLGGLVAWLQGSKIESPGLSLSERLNLVQGMKDRFAKAGDLAARTGDKLMAGWKAFVSQWKGPPVDTDFRGAIKDWLFGKEWTGLETHRFARELRGQVKSKLRRQAISVWVDAGGDEQLLGAQASEVPPRFRRVWETALKLSDSEKALGRRVEQEFREKLEDARNNGLVDQGREDYGMPQVWDRPPKNEGAWSPEQGASSKAKARNPKARLDPRNPFFALERSNPSYFDGIMQGGVPKDLDLAALVSHYNAQFHDALQDRLFIKGLKDVKAADGKPVVVISGRVHQVPRSEGGRAMFVDAHFRPGDAVTEDGRPYQTVDHWALKDWKFQSVDAAKNPVIVHGDFLVHPDHAAYLRNELGKSWFRDPEQGGKYFNPVLNSAAFLKASKFASATFHLATLAEHSMFHAAAGKPSAERLGLLWPSIKGVDMDPGRNGELRELMRAGMYAGFGQAREMFEEGVGSHGGLFRQVPLLGPAMARLSDWMFKDYLPALKYKTASVIFKSNLQRYSADLSRDQVAELTARQVNAAFGGQNWRLMGTNKTWMDFNRLFLTAPDFLLSRSKVVGQALKPYGREQRLFLIAQAGLAYAACRVLNQLLDKDPHWEPANALRVIHNGRAYSARLLVMDLANMVQDPGGFAQGRLGPLPRAAIEGATGRDMRTGARIEPPIPTDNRALRAAEIAIKDLAMWLVPVGVEGVLPGAAGREQTGPGTLALALGGVGSRKYTAESQVYEAAADWARNSTDPAVRRERRRKDAEAVMEGPYRKLDDLLLAPSSPRTTAAARREYEALVSEGFTAEAIRRRYEATEKPFTGSRAREADFRDSLSARLQGVYERAIQEREARREAFERVFPQMELEPALGR